MLATLEQIAQRAYSSLETIQASYDIARAAIANGIRGDFVECGVAAGANAAAMALGLYVQDEEGRTVLHEDWIPNTLSDRKPHENFRRLPQRRVHLFDSFTGIPQAGPEDEEFLAAGHKPGLSAHSRAEVEANLKEWGLPLELFVFHQGLFCETVPCHAVPPGNGPIAVLRLDGDLYESTKVCIEHLYPLVTKGGWVIVDDWDLSGARKAVIEHVGQGFGPVYFQRHA